MKMIGNIELKTIAVTGATGRQGGAVIKHLLRVGNFRVKALTREIESKRAQHLRSLGVEVQKADLDNVESLLQSLAGTDGIFSVQNYWEKNVGYDGEIRQGQNLANVAKQLGIKLFIQSTMADGLTPFPDKLYHFRSKAMIEKHIDSIGLPRTFLGTVTFMDNILDPKLGGKWTFPFISKAIGHNSKYHMLATDDIGGVVASIFLNPGKYIGRKINLSSDTPTIQEMREIYREVSGKPAKKIIFPVWLARMISPEFIEQLEWQAKGCWNFSSDETRSIYPGATTFKKFLINNKVNNL